MPLRAKVTNPALTAATMSTSPQIPREKPRDPPDDVLFNSIYGLRSIELNRPQKLNSLNGSMVRKIAPRLEVRMGEISSCKHHPHFGSRAQGALRRWRCCGPGATEPEKGGEGQRKSSYFFKQEYFLDHMIATYSKPVVSFMDGITMGGGVGLSMHAPFRVATEKTVFAMPETSIGFFPDVGASFFLPRLDGEIGTYLALTSERLNGVQTLYSGIATHYLHSSVLSNVAQRLSELVFSDHSTLDQRVDIVNNTLAEYSLGLPSLQEEPILLGGGLRTAIDRCFQFNTVEEIFQALKNETEYKHWAKETLKTLSSRSPTSLKVTLRQLRLGKKWSIAEAFKREHEIASNFMRHPDFVEGVSARLISKPPRQAEWKPATLDQVSQEEVDAFFYAPEDESVLKLLDKEDYKESPHSRIALPTEAEIQRFITAEAGYGISKKQVVNKFVEMCNQKEGVREKVADVLARRTVMQEDGLRWV
ncbi:3-hydroxyisobutyryl-CoA hydrolase [Penicillium alfredii]|uniref:3-hydroxyisobutyryl-CoA hydrolase n=1 Tax=Penicillium alfredii TaxID=1506179 RepID=A0A9W9FKG6_9EURO|nr:3-hydroxyisobutyryl-CoA hydrolase [Penicillium alfredii]KAJ5101871.1 3-hydroxyisobutyryl-CoA hydrolase [Penicillium alfredii]